ncbi:MAG: amidohydrolase family protein [Ruminococcus sp.]|jgi:predicted TIM-barrel fold metal-dependent hydrolase|nr:amidohydrolase family protein [Ruminococcus sp.]
MYIDFHTHAFADKIYKRAMEVLQNHLREYGYDDTAYSDGSLCGLTDYYKAHNIEAAVLMPIATKPSQQTVINDFANEINNTVHGGVKLYSYGSVHPFAADFKEELRRIKDLGLYGVKLHPDYQEFFVDDKNVYPVYETCAELGLPVLFHAGLDAISPEVIHCIPKAAANVLRDIPGLTAIFAHMGGNVCWDDVEKYLVGKQCYLDTAYSHTWKPSQIKRIIDSHGSENILFASDFPWDVPDVIAEKIMTLDLSEKDRDNIFFKNAQKLLDLNRQNTISFT